MKIKKTIKQAVNKSLIMCLLLWLYMWNMQAQERNFTISGNVRDAASGEDLIGVSILIEETSRGTVTNAYGYYSLSLPKGTYKLVFIYLGYHKKEKLIELSSDTKLNIDLDTDAQMLAEVVVSPEGKNVNVTRPEMSVEKLSSRTIKQMPMLVGETDIIKAIQLLPGVQATTEGSSGFSVRGGGYDQNLILLDEATVYSASHLMGFFSVFNNDAIKDITLYKGDIPAWAGGRLSSLLDIRTKDGNNQHYAATGGIGLISSRLTFEGPINEKASFIASGRRTYADMFLKLSGDENLSKALLYFYDMNAKMNYRIDDNNRIFLAGYFGRDRFGMNKVATMDFGNKTITARWNHIFSPKLFSNFSLIGSTYSYYITDEMNEQMEMAIKSGLEDYGLKADFNYMPNPIHNLKFGYNFVYHGFHPRDGGGLGDNPIYRPFSLPIEYAIENAAYVANETYLNNNSLKLKYGLRYVAFSNLDKGSIVYHQQQFEPRAGIIYTFNDIHSMKASYSRTTQFVQLASNSAAGSPLALWFQASELVKPQKCNQWGIGYFRNLVENRYELSAEVYYKDMKDVVDFQDHAQLLLTEDLKSQLRFGKGYSYGLELMLRKTTGVLNGWISYTLSKSMRLIDDINEGRWYRSPYDRPHNISAVAVFELSPRWTISANWVYASGMPVTYPTGRYLIENVYVPIYSGRNEYRYPSYHRLDLSATKKLSRPGKRFKHELNIALYNAYGRKNPWIIRFQPEPNNPDKMSAEMLFLFTFIPAVTWNFSF